MPYAQPEKDRALTCDGVKNGAALQTIRPAAEANAPAGNGAAQSKKQTKTPFTLDLAPFIGADSAAQG